MSINLKSDVFLKKNRKIRKVISVCEMLMRLVTYTLLTICLKSKNKETNLSCVSSPSMLDSIREHNNRLMLNAKCCVECLERYNMEVRRKSVLAKQSNDPQYYLAYSTIFKKQNHDLHIPKENKTLYIAGTA